MHGMLMFASTFVAKHSHLRAHDVIAIIIVGFFWSLCGWWDNYLEHSQYKDHLSVIDLATKGKPVAEKKPNENSIYTLVTFILNHFMSVVVDQGECTRYMLQKLRCSYLTHFHHQSYVSY